MMNFEQVYETAESECTFFKDPISIKVCVGSSSDNPIDQEIVNRLRTEIKNNGINAEVITTGSFGYYDLEPLVMIEKPDQSTAFSFQVNAEKVSDLVKKLLRNDSQDPDMSLSDSSNHPLFNLQKRIALRNCGRIDPENINHYILVGKGYSGLSKALHMSRTDVIEALKKSGLKGKGGAGFVAADKWKACFDEEEPKYVICNAVDSDPQAQTARLLLEGDPHSVLEGLLIGACAVGASKCFVVVNADYEVARQRLEKALDQMREYNLLGEKILDSPFNCDIEVMAVEAPLVVGEETALLRSLENKQAMPYIRPPYPATRGFSGKPTLIQNIETLTNVSAFFQDGLDQGMETKVMTISGDAVHKYTVEVPSETTLRGVVEDIGGGVSNSKVIKAVQLGGPTGPLLPADSLDIPIDYGSISEAGAMIGSGTVRVIDSNSCSVELVNDIIAYLQNESCGKCVFCREGTFQMSDIMKDISEFKGRPQDLDLLKELGEAMKQGGICGLGRTASNPVLSSIELFREEYDAHIKEKRCPANLVKED